MENDFILLKWIRADLFKCMYMISIAAQFHIQTVSRLS